MNSKTTNKPMKLLVALSLSGFLASTPPNGAFAHSSGGSSSHSSGMTNSSGGIKNTIHPIIYKGGNKHSDSSSKRGLEKKLRKLERKEKRLKHKLNGNGSSKSASSPHKYRKGD